jgi:hypothetical protein
MVVITNVFDKKKKGRFEHLGVSRIDFSPKEKFLVTASVKVAGKGEEVKVGRKECFRVFFVIAAFFFFKKKGGRSENCCSARDFDWKAQT